MTACTMIHLSIKDTPDSIDLFIFVTADIFTKIKIVR